MTYGTDALHELIEESGWSYPIKMQKLEQEHALADIEIDEAGNSIMLAELLEGIDVNQIESREELERLMDPVIEQEVEDRRSGLIGKIKRAFSGKS